MYEQFSNPSLKSIPSLNFPPTTHESKAPQVEELDEEEGKDDDIYLEYSEKTSSEDCPKEK